MGSKASKRNSIFGARLEQIAAGVFLLALAFTVTLSFPGRIDPVQTIAWFFNYDHGYTHRGLMGSAFQLLHGPITMEKIHEFVPLYEKGLLTVIVCLFWAMFIPRIWRSSFSYHDKWVLMAFVAVPMLAPAWKHHGLHAGFLDEWVLMFALLAFLCFLFRKPIGYICCILPAFFVHPQAVFYALLLTMLIVHSLIRNRNYSRHWRIWMLAALLPPCVSGLLYLLHSFENTNLFMDANKQELLKAMSLEFFEYNKYIYLDPSGTDHALVMTRWTLWPYSVITGVIVYAGPIFAYAMLFSHQITKTAAPNKSEYLSLDWRFFRKIINYETYIIMTLSLFYSSPIFFTADWGRNFYLIWGSAGIAAAYFIWFYDQTSAGDNKSKKRSPKAPRRRSKAISRGLAGFMALWAYAYAGMPLTLGNLTDPSTFNPPFERLHFPLNRNPLGELYAETAMKIMALGNTVAVYADAGAIYRRIDSINKDTPVGLKDGRLAVPAGLKHSLWSEYIRILADKKVVFTVNHESGGSVALYVNNSLIRPSLAAEDRTVWVVNAASKQDTVLLHFAFHAQGSKNFEVSSFGIDYM